MTSSQDGLTPEPQPKRLEIFLAPEQHRALKAIAAFRGRSMKAEAAAAMEDHIRAGKTAMQADWL